MVLNIVQSKSFDCNIMATHPFVQTTRTSRHLNF